MMSSLVPVTELKGHSERVWDVAWSPDGRSLASCGADRGLRIWSINSKGLELLQQSESLSDASALDGCWSCEHILDDIQSRTIRSCAFSHCGKYLATASFDSTTIIWEKRMSEETNTFTWGSIATLEGHENEVKCVSWSKNGKYLATCSRDKSVWIWAVPGAEEGTGDAMATDDWDAISVLNGHTQDVKFVEWSPTENNLFSASYDDSMRVWAEDVDDWGCFEIINGHKNTVWGISFQQDGNKLASCSQDKTIKIWENTETSQGYKWGEVQSIDNAHTRTIFSIHWQGDYLVSGGADDCICVFKIGPDGKFATVDKKEAAHPTDINCVRWNPKFTNLCASASDDTMVKIWYLQ